MAEVSIQQQVDDFANAHDTDVVVYFGDVTRGEDAYLIDQCQSRRLRKNVLLLLATYGGDPNAAYRISRCFQRAFNTCPKQLAGAVDPSVASAEKGTFTVYVDSICKSAGTIICIGADRLVMSDNAELGPIDIQLRKQDEVGERTSGLTPIQSVQFLETQSVLLFKRHFRALRDSAELGFSTRMAADIATRLTTGLLAPIYQQIDPIRLAEVDRSLKISKDYGERLTHNGNLAAGAVDKLLARYPSHGFVIDREEAAQLFNDVAAPNAAQAQLMDLFRGISRVTLAKDDTFVYFMATEPNPPSEQEAVTNEANPSSG